MTAIDRIEVVAVTVVERPVVGEPAGCLRDVVALVGLAGSKGPYRCKGLLSVAQGRRCFERSVVLTVLSSASTVGRLSTKSSYA